MMFNKKTHQANVKKLFYLDALGALLSVFLLGIVLVQLEWFFGFPKSALYILASIPVIFFIYDLLCLKLIKSNLGPYLKIIAIANISYCFISIGFAVYHQASVTIWGWVYLFLETIILIILALIEWRTAQKASIIL